MTKGLHPPNAYLPLLCATLTDNLVSEQPGAFIIKKCKLPQILTYFLTKSCYSNSAITYTVYEISKRLNRNFRSTVMVGGMRFRIRNPYLPALGTLHQLWTSRSIRRQSTDVRKLSLFSIKSRTDQAAVDIDATREERSGKFV